MWQPLFTRYTVSGLIIVWAGLFAVLTPQGTRADSSPFNPRQRYCFRFTWIGPKYNNESVFQNATCEEIVGERARVPCQRPLIVSDNGNLPNTTWIWDNYRSNVSDIACRLSPSDVCVKYTYKYNQAVENITYLCSKVRIENEGTARSMCYTEFQNGREIEVCVCESRAGSPPCNGATGATGDWQWPMRWRLLAALATIGWVAIAV